MTDRANSPATPRDWDQTVVAAPTGLTPEVRAAIRRLLQTLTHTRVTELSIETPDGSVRLRRQPPGEAERVDALIRESPPRPEASATTIQAGLVGVFHRSAKPGAAPLVQPGDHVNAGQLVAVITTLDFVNEVHTPVAGVVREILTEDNAPVEYGQPLLVIET